MKEEWVYVIRSIKKNYTYTGITNNLERRLLEHNKGYNKSTRLYMPYKLLLKEVYVDKKSAREREKFLKSGQGRKFLSQFK